MPFNCKISQSFDLFDWPPQRVSCFDLTQITKFYPSTHIHPHPSINHSHKISSIHPHPFTSQPQSVPSSIHPSFLHKHCPHPILPSVHQPHKITSIHPPHSCTLFHHPSINPHLLPPLHPSTHICSLFSIIKLHLLHPFIHSIQVNHSTFTPSPHSSASS